MMVPKYSADLQYNQEIPIMFRGENIKTGVRLTWDIFGTLAATDQIERLVCANGMVTTKSATFINASTNIQDFYHQLFNHISNPNKELIANYEQRVLQAMQTNISLNEFNIINEKLANWVLDAHIIKKYIGDGSWLNDYKNRNINIENLSTRQQSFCQTPINAWDAINCLTDLSSHEYIANVDDYTKVSTQLLAGKLLNRDWDFNNNITNLPTYKVEPRAF